jgi:hypothetical protein
MKKGQLFNWIRKSPRSVIMTSGSLNGFRIQDFDTFACFSAYPCGDVYNLYISATILLYTVVYILAEGLLESER